MPTNLAPQLLIIYIFLYPCYSFFSVQHTRAQKKKMINEQKKKKSLMRRKRINAALSFRAYKTNTSLFSSTKTMSIPFSPRLLFFRFIHLCCNHPAQTPIKRNKPAKILHSAFQQLMHTTPSQRIIRTCL